MSTSYNLTGDLSDLLGSTSVAATARARLETNLPPTDALVDTTGATVLLGTLSVPIESDGTFSLTGLVGSDSIDLNVDAGTLQYQLVVDYRDPGVAGSGRRGSPDRTWRSGWFFLNQNEDIATVAKSATPAVAATGAEIITAAAAEADRAEAAAAAAVAPTDTQVATLAQDPTSETGQALSATYARGGGKTKTDGQNPKNLRRPTLVVDKMYPNARHDHQVVWVDETEKIAYAVDQTERLRKCTWVAEGDEALIFGDSLSGAAAGERWAPNGVFMRIPTSGELLMEKRASNVTTLLRSTNDGTTWTTVWTSPGNSKMFLGPQSIARDAATGYLYLVEYTTDVAATTVDIWRSTDKGATWAVWHSHPRSEAVTPGVLRHWHSARYDSVSQRVYFSAGDQQADAGIYRVNAAGTGIEPVVTNSQLTHYAPAAARSVDLMFFPDYIAWACDGSGAGQNHVYRIPRTDIGAATPDVERIAAIDNTGWYAVNASDDGTVWVCSTAAETPTPETSDHGIVHLYAVTDNGATVDELAMVSMGGGALGFGNISGLGGASGSGQSFWMRAHNYQQFPNQTYSAFQFRARLGYGVSQIIKPNNQRQSEYLRQGRNWSGTLTPGQTFTFAHSRAPRRTRALSMLDFGARAVVGTFGAARLEIWNATTNTKVYEYSGASWRSDTSADTQERWASFTFGDRDLVEFRVTNTGTSDITGSVFIEFGWAFF